MGLLFCVVVAMTEQLGDTYPIRRWKARINAVVRAPERLAADDRGWDRAARTITVKLKTSDFRSLTRRRTLATPPAAAAELAGFAMEGHAATRWLATNAPVRAGEVITLVFSIFDMNNGKYDSAVALDHFEWTCSGAPPFTTPVG